MWAVASVGLHSTFPALFFRKTGAGSETAPGFDHAARPAMKVSDRGCAVVAAKFLALTPLLWTSIYSIPPQLQKG
jgi:hypothetical protein